MTKKQAALYDLAMQLAQMDTPTDGITNQEKADDVMADLDDERLCSDASALYALIRRARAIMMLGG